MNVNWEMVSDLICWTAQVTVYDACVNALQSNSTTPIHTCPLFLQVKRSASPRPTGGFPSERPVTRPRSAPCPILSLLLGDEAARFRRYRQRHSDCSFLTTVVQFYRGPRSVEGNINVLALITGWTELKRNVRLSMSLTCVLRHGFCKPCVISVSWRSQSLGNKARVIRGAAFHFTVRFNCVGGVAGEYILSKWLGDCSLSFATVACKCAVDFWLPGIHW